MTLDLNPQVVRHLDKLVEIGVHGLTREAVAERLICQQLERLLIDGVLRDVPL